ncbi:MAG: tRNA (N6-isopentenyl adenosine(37)-C2)-methylthiotransferase MiaB [Deltaproteobacteria bacterium]|nr:tRNA (N6-isopentenyl adenosine(37)-C2)-methylthiotransferase MiaB [Deltaproteobacteria bacterium]
MPPKKLYIKTFGCQMNVYDSERIAHLLAAKNYQLVENPSEADLVFLNTCNVREKPEQKVYSALGRLRVLKKKKSKMIIGIGGCLAQQEGEAFLQSFPHVDFVVGTKEISRIAELLNDLEAFGKRGLAVNLSGRLDPYATLPFSLPSSSTVVAFVSIMQGCDNFCSFCIVPYVRGREVSRASQEILKEIQSLASQGVKEVTLLGQNVNSYGQTSPGDLDFVELLKAVQEIAGIERIRFTTSHPKDLSTPLIKAFGKFPKLCEHIHLPLQNGSARILQRMNRGYSPGFYLEKIKDLRQSCPGISVTTDMIVGFPGEEEEDFHASMEMIEKVQFDDLFSFKYSDRPGTRATLFNEKVPEGIAQRRLVELQALQRKITWKRNKAWEGKDVEVLVEGRSKANPEENMGRTRTNHIVNFPGKTLTSGAIVQLRIQKAYAHSLRGEEIL